jgi:hypothetical protein
MSGCGPRGQLALRTLQQHRVDGDDDRARGHEQRGPFRAQLDACGGNRTPAAIGIASRLQIDAKPRFCFILRTVARESCVAAATSSGGLSCGSR